MQLPLIPYIGLLLHLSHGIRVLDGQFRPRSAGSAGGSIHPSRVITALTIPLVL